MRISVWSLPVNLYPFREFKCRIADIGKILSGGREDLNLCRVCVKKERGEQGSGEKGKEREERERGRGEEGAGERKRRREKEERRGKEKGKERGKEEERKRGG